MKPILKWAGGKQWLAAIGIFEIPEDYRYVEPFFGSGALFFSYLPKQANLSDSNRDLIEFNRVLRDQPNAVYGAVQEHKKNHSKQYYYDIRSTFPDNEVQRAARFLYLNRTCWNGLYRVNKQGKFNVPIGTRDTIIYPEEDFQSYAKALKNANIKCCDFEESMNSCREGDVIFVDPPYTVKHNMNGFARYNESIFSWADQERLKDSIIRARNRGAVVIVANADHYSIQNLYANQCRVLQLSRYSGVSSKREFRRNITEALYIFYPENVRNRYNIIRDSGANYSHILKNLPHQHYDL